jgi:glutamine synthetase
MTTRAPEHFYLGDIRETDGTPWSCCPRDFLRRGLAALEEVAGLRMLSAFEQEFVYTGVEELPGAAYSLDAYRRQGIFGEAFTAALRQSGVIPDSFLPEYGPRQYEVTCQPALGVRAADDAIVMREIARSTAQRLGARAIFSPILDPNGVGNGVHIHMSFQDSEGKPVMRDPPGPMGWRGRPAPSWRGAETSARALRRDGALHGLLICASRPIAGPHLCLYRRSRP